MERLIIIVALVALLSACASYKTDVMEPWVGATLDELTNKWGYPQTANDVFKIDDETTIFTYRSFREGFVGPIPCLVSFTIKKKIVSGFKYEGGNCPRIKK